MEAAAVQHNGKAVPMDSPTLKLARVLKEADRSSRQSRRDGFAKLEALDVKRDVPVTSRATSVELTQVSSGSSAGLRLLATEIDSFIDVTAMPPDVRRGSAPPGQSGLNLGLCPWFGLRPSDWTSRPKAEPGA